MTKKKQESNNKCDWITILKDYEISNMLKAGVKYYIESKQITIKDEKDLEKIIKEYKEIKL